MKSSAIVVRRTRRLGCTLGCGLLLAGIVSQPSTADALVFFRGKGLSGGEIALLMARLAVVGGTIAFSALNGVYAGKGERPHEVLLAMGYVFGTGSLALGTIDLTRQDESGPILGGIHLSLGGLTLGMTIWGHTRDPASTGAGIQSFWAGPSLAPMVLLGRQGSVAWGLSLRFPH